jgi:tetratricopeptide (TPR) repeat protein
MSRELDLLLQRVKDLQRAGRLAEALDSAKGAVALEPQSRSANLALATLEARTGNQRAAVDRFLAIADSDPQCFDALFGLSVLYRGSGEYGLSLEYGRSALKLRPEEPHVYSNLGLTLLSAHRLQEAVECFQKATRLAPSIPQNYPFLGRALVLLGRDEEARAVYETADRLAPDLTETLVALGQIAMNQNRDEEALAYGKRALAADPSSSSAHVLIAGALINQGLGAQAEGHLQAALNSEKVNSQVYATLGTRMQSLGRMAEAEAAFKKSIELRPDQGYSYCALVRSASVTVADEPMLAKMQSLLEQADVSALGKGYLHYGLGKAREDLGKFEMALGHFDQANEILYRLKFGDGVFNRDRLADFVDWTIAHFPKGFLRGNRAEDTGGRGLLFIVGMMRSGTTLVEQILSSHPLVEGAGERTFWLAHAQEAVTAFSEPASGRRQELAKAYLDELRMLFPAAAFVTDKMPGNYRVLGAIASAFPEARIIHTRRHPIDTCLSIYSTPNRSANEFAHNRSNIVFAYRQYERLMAHWIDVLPADRLMTVEYEKLVADQGSVTRRMVEFCGLPWDELCLRPQDNERSIVTPSVWQVRQPVYRSSIERWKRFEPWLGEFLSLRPPA